MKSVAAWIGFFALACWFPVQQVGAVTLPGTILINRATLTYNSPSRVVSRVATNNTGISTINGMTMYPDQSVTLNLEPGSSAEIPLQIYNSGNTPITINRQWRSLTSSWSVNLILDANKNSKRDSWETTPVSASFSLNTTPNNLYFIAVITAPLNPSTDNTTAIGLLDFVSTGNVDDGPGYLGYNGTYYGGPDVITVTFNLSAAHIEKIYSSYSVSDNTIISDNIWSNHDTPYFYWECSPDNVGFSYSLTTNPTVVPDNTLDLDSQTSSFHSPAMTHGYYYFKIKLKDLNGMWSTPNVFMFKLDNFAPNVPATPSDSGAFVTSNMVQITWPAVIDNGFAGLNRYEVSVGSSPGLSDVTQNAGTFTTAFSFIGTNNTTYYCKVRAVDNAGNLSNWSPYTNGIFVDLTPTVTLRCRVSSTNYGDIASNSWTQWTHPYFYWTGSTFNMGYSYCFSTDPALVPDNAIDTTANFFVPPTLNSEIYYFKIRMLRAELLDGTRIWSTTVNFTYKLDVDIVTPDRVPGLQSRYVLSNPGKFLFDVVTDNYHGSGVSEYWVKVWADHGLGVVFDGTVAASQNYYTYYGADGYTYQVQYRLRDAAGNMSIFSPLSASMSFLVSSDTDHDGIPSTWELAYGLDPLVSADALSDHDYDGLSNFAEFVASTNPFVNNRILLDSDHDGMPDEYESRMLLNAFLASDAYDDPDNDHVPSILEYYNGTPPKSSRDSDSDGLPDDWEKGYGTNPNKSDGGLDLDGDGVTNYQDFLNGTQPNDYDNDGLPDGWELKYQTVRSGKAIDPHDATDGGYAEDLDGDGLPNWLEFRCGTSATMNIDTDGDGLSDDYENVYGFNPLVAEDHLHVETDINADKDHDGQSNLAECRAYTDPLNPNRIPPSSPAVTINNKIMDTGNYAVLANRATTMTGMAQPGTIVELWNIIGRNQQLLDRELVGSSGVYRLTFKGQAISASLQILSIDSAGNQTAINRLVLYDDQDPQVASLKIDGAVVMDGDVISSRPTIVAQLSYSVMGLNTANIILTLQPLNGSSSNVYHITSNIMTYEDNQLRYLQQTSLAAGKYNLILYIEDIAGRSSTLTLNNLTVIGGSHCVVGRPLNYPNPFSPDDADPLKRSTRICYTLNDNMDITLVIYTSAAEKVWERNYLAGGEGAHAGYNEVLWNGRTDATEDLGNGVYLFHLVANVSGKRKIMGKGKILIKR